MSEKGTAVAPEQEEMAAGGLFTKKQFEGLKQDIEDLASERDDVPREVEPVAADTPPEPSKAEPADEPSRTPELETTEPEVPEPAEPATKVDEESPAAGFDDQLLARAEQMGFSKEAAQSFGTPDKLETALTVLDQRLIGMGKPKQVAEPAPVVSPTAPPPVAPPVQVPAPAPQTIDALKIDLDPQEHDTAIVAQFEKMRDHYEARANQFEQAFVTLVTAMQSGQKQSEDQVVNQSIDGLNGDLKGLITPEVRAQIQPTALGLARGLKQAGLPVPAIPELVLRAARSLVAEELLKQEHTRATDEISEKLEKRSRQRTAPPVQHRYVEPGLSQADQEKQTVKDIRGFMDDRNMR